MTPQGDWVPEDEHSTRELDDDADGAAHVEQSRRGATAQHGRHSAGRRLRAEAERRHAAERAVAGARRERRHAALADGGVRRLRQRGHRPAAGVRSAASRTATARSCTCDQSHGAARGQRIDGVPDVEHARRRHQLAAPPIAPGSPASRCRPRGKPARPTTTSTPGSSASRRTSSRASGSASISRRRSSPTAMPASSPFRSWASFMKVATKGHKPDWIDASRERRRRSTSAAYPASCRTRGAPAST